MKYCLYRAQDGTESLIEFIPIESFWCRLKALAKCDELNEKSSNADRYVVGINKL